MPPDRPGNSNSPIGSRTDISDFPNRFVGRYKGKENGTYDLLTRDGDLILNLDGGAFSRLGTDTEAAVLEEKQLAVPDRFECERVVRSAENKKRVHDYVCEYEVGDDSVRFRFADMTLFSYTDGRDPSAAYLPPLYQSEEENDDD